THGDNTATTMSIPRLLGAGTFYDAGYPGTRAAIANIEGGQADNTHEAMTWITSGNYFVGSGAIPGAIQSHATAVSFTMVGKGATDLQRGVAYGIPNGSFFTGNVATGYSGGSFASAAG